LSDVGVNSTGAVSYIVPVYHMSGLISMLKATKEHKDLTILKYSGKLSWIV